MFGSIVACLILLPLYAPGTQFEDDDKLTNLLPKCEVGDMNVKPPKKFFMIDGVNTCSCEDDQYSSPILVCTHLRVDKVIPHTGCKVSAKVIQGGPKQIEVLITTTEPLDHKNGKDQCACLNEKLVCFTKGNAPAGVGLPGAAR